MELNNILKTIKSNFSPRKKVDFDEAGLHFELEPLTAEEELKVIEGCKNIEDVQYIEALKRHSLACSIKKINNVELGRDIDYEDVDGNTLSKSKFLYMLDFISECPSSLIDVLFDAFTDMSKEIENKVLENVKFKRFEISEKLPEEGKKETLRKIKETEPIGITETEKMDEKIKKEIDERTAHMADVENEAILKAK